MNAISSDLMANMAYLNQVMRTPRNEDFKTHEFDCLGTTALICYVEGMIDSDTVNLSVLRPCAAAEAPDALAPEKRIDYVQTHLVHSISGEFAEDIDKVMRAMLTGKTALFINGSTNALLFDAPGFATRSVSQPITENVIVGPHEGFVENLRTNITLVRRIIQSPRLVTEIVKIGEVMPTRVALLYMDGIARPSIIQSVRERITDLNMDSITGIGELQQLIEDSAGSLLPQALSTERPDRTASCLMDGQVALICDGSPNALIAPITLYHLLHAPDDTAMRWQYGTFIRIIRALGMLLSLFLPGLYVALLLFHPEILPLGLLTSIMETHAKVPFPTVIEVLIMILSFDLIQESALRVPGALGNTLGIVGALILGQAAVAADVISPILVIIVALTGLGNYAVPDYQLSVGIRIARLICIFAGQAGGLFGISLVLFYGCAYVAGQTSFGQPMLAPIAPYRPHNLDIVIRGPIWDQLKRLFIADPAYNSQAKQPVRRWRHLSLEKRPPRE